MKPFIEPLVDGHVWLRVAKASWADPLDPTYAKDHGGRWNRPRSHATLYLNEDLATARAQIPRMLEGYPATAEDLDDEFVLVGATLPARQVVADAVSDQGLEALGLPASYPAHANGRPVRRATCQPVGEQVAAMGLRGIRARSAATRDGSGRELAWFPARRTSRATQAGDAIPFHAWWDAEPGIKSG